jgi:biotin carboxyl carrier protein
MDRIRKEHIITCLWGIILIAGCHQSVTDTGKSTSSAIPVTVSSLRRGPMASYVELSATSSYLFKAIVRAPVTGYIENMFITQGDGVKINQQLFTIRTKEASAIMNDSLSSLKFKGIVDVKSVESGLVSTIEHPKGDYVAEGDLLCQIAVPESFVFILDIPFEL